MPRKRHYDILESQAEESQLTEIEISPIEEYIPTEEKPKAKKLFKVQNIAKGSIIVSDDNGRAIRLSSLDYPEAKIGDEILV